MRRRLQHIAIISLMAFLWLAQVSHCYAGKIPGMDFLECNGTNAESEAHSCCGGTCKTVESQSKAEEKKRGAEAQPKIPHWLTASLFPLLVEKSETERAIVSADVPPEFPKCWQFIARTALPVRAPSVIS